MTVQALNQHADRPVRLEQRDGRQVVVKGYAAPVAREVYAVMNALWASRLGPAGGRAGMPEPLSLEGAELVMAYVPGPPLGVRGDVGATGERLAELCLLLADLHTSLAPVARRRSGAALLRSCARKREELATPTLRALADEAISAMAAQCPSGETLVPSHGDFSPRNVIVGPEGLVLIDFDRVQLAGAGRDVGYLGAWAWVTALTSSGPARSGAVGASGWALGDEAAARYAALRPESAKELAATLAFHRAASLVRIAHGWSALQDRPDLAAEVLTEAVRLTSR